MKHFLASSRAGILTRCCCSRIAFSEVSGYANTTPDLVRFAPAAEQQIR